MEMLTPEEGRTAVHLARSAIENAVSGDRTVLPDLPAVFLEKRGVFVTIKRQEHLRGCIGLPYPIKPLGDALIEAAVSAALEDPRFPPVSRPELADIDLEVTVGPGAVVPPKAMAEEDVLRREEVARV